MLLPCTVHPELETEQDIKCAEFSVQLIYQCET
jgi:hypothetical protein